MHCKQRKGLQSYECDKYTVGPDSIGRPALLESVRLLSEPRAAWIMQVGSSQQKKRAELKLVSLGRKQQRAGQDPLRENWFHPWSSC